jgi:hypothetical protein
MHIKNYPTLCYMHIKNYLTYSKNEGKRQTDVELGITNDC